jgi:site-specific DNA-adenine methylase
MYHGRSSKDNELNNYIERVKERPIRSNPPIERNKFINDRFLYCDPPEVILQSKSYFN